MSVSKKSVSGLSFEAALSELETIVSHLEKGKVELEQAIDFYTRGMALKTHCESKLADAKLKVEQLSINANGDIETRPFDAEE